MSNVKVTVDPKVIAKPKSLAAIMYVAGVYGRLYDAADGVNGVERDCGGN